VKIKEDKKKKRKNRNKKGRYSGGEVNCTNTENF
jgi:hypothetical protein